MIWNWLSVVARKNCCVADQLLLGGAKINASPRRGEGRFVRKAGEVQEAERFCLSGYLHRQGRFFFFISKGSSAIFIKYM